MATGRSGTKMGVDAMYNHEVPRTQHTERAMVEITAPASAKKATAALDLVVVLDTSGSMKGEKLLDAKIATKAVIDELKSSDALTIVPFSSKAGALSHKSLQRMNKPGQKAAKDFVNKLTANGDTNIQDGLQTAIRILGAPDKTKGRVQGILLMTDGDQHIGNAALVDVRHLPVFTYGFGKGHKAALLKQIAENSHGGTYNYVQHPTTNENFLAKYFAKVLGILRHITALDVSVTLTPQAGAKILAPVEPGKYPVTPNKNGSFTVHFGEMARNERRTILVTIQLPAVANNESAKTYVHVQAKYLTASELNNKPSTDSYDIKMDRKQGARLRAPSGHFATELARRHQAERIEKVKRLADGQNLDQAKEELADAHNALSNVEATEDTAPLHDALSLELSHIEELLESQDVYVSHGHPYMLAAILSHGRQRFAARGGEDDIMLFVLPRMLTYAGRAVEFHKKANARA